MNRNLPAWAEATLTSLGPQAAFGAEDPDAASAARYAAIVERFRLRWQELQTDVWSRFTVGGVFYERQAQTLLCLMVDLARGGTPEEMRQHREALVELERLEAVLRRHAEDILSTAAAHAELARSRAIDGGIEAADIETLRAAAAHLVAQNWAAPRLLGVGYADAINSRKTAADSLRLLLAQLEWAQLDPVRLTDHARATIYNVTHNAEQPYAAEDIKVARHRMRQAG